MNTKKESISILGCGWLGLALAESLVKQGFEVKGSVMNEEDLDSVSQIGAKAFKIALAPNLNNDADTSFFQSDVLISCIPPKRREDIEAYYPKQIENLIEHAKQAEVKKILFVSSTSVYPNTRNVVKENDILSPDKASGRALIQVEQMLMNENAFDTTVLRFGGLIGYDRHPGRFLAGRKELKNGNVPVNLIHRDDCIEIIQEILKQNCWNEVFHACCPEHPTRKEFYQKAAEHTSLELPEFKDELESEYKLVDPSKLIDSLNYEFIYKNPLNTICS